MNLGAKSQSLVPSEGSKTTLDVRSFSFHLLQQLGTLRYASSSSSLHIFFCRLLKILTSIIPQLQPPARCSPAAISSVSQLQPVRVRRSNVLIPLATLATTPPARGCSLRTSCILRIVPKLLLLSRLELLCGKKQSGKFLEGIAPDGVMGLGPGEISVPSFLAKAGLMRNSFSMCFDEEDSGRIYFGDMGPSTQQSTLFLPYNNDFVAYIVGVEACCIGNSCLKQTNFTTLIDSGQSFTFLPEVIYREVALEIDSHINATVKKIDGGPWEYCYETSVMPKVPAIKLKFSSNNSFLIHKPLFVLQRSQGLVQFCLPISATEEGTGGVIGRQEDKIAPPQEASPGSPSSPNPLPTEEQQSRSHAVSPAIAGKTPSKHHQHHAASLP
ncbi:hypothetical protein Bca4012_046567 [Brassica carinata]